jgi:peptidoglycan/LPS O-acetylase OafA/YrhL
LPIWLMGVALQRSATIRRLPVAANIVLCVCGLSVAAWIMAVGACDPAIAAMARVVGPSMFTQLAQARVFWFDWIFGLAIAAHLLGARAMTKRIPFEWIAKPVRWCASVSFAAYLFHMPLLTLFAAFLPVDKGLVAIGLTLVIIALLGPPVERSKRWWRIALNKIADQLAVVSQRHPAILSG